MHMPPSQSLVKQSKTMLKIFNNLHDIDFRQLMDVYAETNIMNGTERYGRYSENLRILYAEQDFYNYLCLFFKENSARYAVWERDGVYMAALRIEHYADGLIMSALETAPEHRCKGCASLLIKSTIRYLKTLGKGMLYSHINKSNYASLLVHKRCGFRVISEEAEYLDGTIVRDAYTLSLEY